MRNILLAVIATAIGLIFSSSIYAAAAGTDHQAIPLVAAPTTSASPVNVPFVRTSNGPGISPGIGITAPTGFGADWGDVFFGVGGNYDSINKSRSIDGSGYIGFGLGDAERWVGLEATANLISISDDITEAYSFTFKLHRQLGERTAVAIGTDHTARGGTANPDQSYKYLALTHIFTLNADEPSKMMAAPLTVGFGDGRFSEFDVPTISYDNKANLFISGGVVVHPKVSVLAEWVGHQFNFGASFVPFEQAPFVITTAVLDLTGKYYERPDLGFALGYTWQFGD